MVNHGRNDWQTVSILCVSMTASISMIPKKAKKINNNKNIYSHGLGIFYLLDYVTQTNILADLEPF